MASAMRHTGHQGTAQKALAIDYIVIPMRADGSKTCSNLTQRRRRVQRLAPATPGDRNSLAGGWMQAHQRRKSLLHQPGESRIAARPPGIGQGRHVMNHIAERRCLDEKDVGHGAFAALIYRSLSMPAITMPSRDAIKMRLLRSLDTFIGPIGGI